MKETPTDKVSQIEKIYEEYRNLIYAIAYDILRDEEWAKDALQETLLRMIKNYGRLDTMKAAELKNYVARMARNTGIDLYNKRKKAQGPPDGADMDEAIETNTPEDFVITNESVEFIVEEIKRMDPKYSDPLRFQKFNKYSIEQISKIMGISQRTVHYRIEKAKRILAEKLRRRGDIDD